MTRTERRFEAIVFHWPGVEASGTGDNAEWRLLLDDLRAHGMMLGIVSVESRDRISSELGEVLPDPGGAVVAADELAVLHELERRGMSPAVTVVLGGDSNRPIEILRDQLRRRQLRQLPEAEESPTWSMRVDGFDVYNTRAIESQLTLANGRLGASGSPFASHPSTTAWVFSAGLYEGDGPETALLPCPVWQSAPWPVEPGQGLVRVLQLRSGLIHEQLQLPEGTVRSVRFVSLARPSTVALRAEIPAGVELPARPLVLPPERNHHSREDGTRGDRQWMKIATSTGGVAAAAVDRLATTERGATLERVAAYASDPWEPPEVDDALAQLAEAEAAGFERLLLEHRAAWAKRWDEADVMIEGDDELQLAVRFALFHLMAAVADTDEAAVGARGLSGPAYRGHVFWDGDTFVLPFLAATHPASARAMLEYRIRRIPAAREVARGLGRGGARFPWESARVGNDVTPPSVRDQTGRLVPIRTGQLEEHIVAEVAWAAHHYHQWTGDEEFAAGPGTTLLVETARYWASRIRIDVDGTGHVYGVIGPDEYHEPVDDNAFTNVMARWNLRHAAAHVLRYPYGAHEPVSEAERRRWLEIADAVSDNYDPASGLYEEFAGFFKLEPLVIEEIAPRRPIVADLLLGRDRVQGAQVVKQADVMMLHHLLPQEVAPGSLEPNLRYYEPRTAHGSSLSPGIHASLFARAGWPDRALEALHLAARIDLDDLTDTSAGGLHMATFGSVWQALAFGFAGLRPHDGVLAIDPRPLPGWKALELRLRFHQSRVEVRVEPDALTISADPPIPVSVRGWETTVGPDGTRVEPGAHGWEVSAS